MRRFSFEKSGEQSINLNGGDYFLENPTGLGATLDPPLNDLRGGFFRIADTNIIPNETITADIICKSYTAYKTLANWLLRKIDFDLVYSYGTMDYTRTVTLSSISKTEAMLGGRLRCPIVLKCLTPWVAHASITFSESEDPVASLYGKAYEASAVWGSQIPLAFKVTTQNGAIPKMITAWDLSEILENPDAPTFMWLDATKTAQYAGDKFEYSNEQINSYVRVTHDGEQISLLDALVLTKNAFGRVPISGVQKIFIIFDEDEENIPTISGELIAYFRSV